MSRPLCRAVVEGLRKLGVREIVVSPGSRSTPLLLAAIEADFKLVSAIDERSAAFFGLGTARAQGRPVAMLCTSGSAGAHYLPALLEARYAEIPLVAITADRPAELHGSDANQTIEQHTLLQAACPRPLMIGADVTKEQCAILESAISELFAEGNGPRHVNIAFRKPLESEGAPAPRPSNKRTTSAPLRDVADALAVATRPLVVMGPGSAAGNLALAKLCQDRGLPYLAESTSGARFCGQSSAACSLRFDAFPHLARHPAATEELIPDLVVRTGGALACSPLQGLLDRCPGPRFRFAENARQWTFGSAEAIVLGALPDTVTNLRQAISDPSSRCARSRNQYRDDWRRWEGRAWHAVERHIQDAAEPAILRKIVASLPPQTQLSIGNSLSVRLLDTIAPSSSLPPLSILHQRGTSGIDGLVAGAIGASSRELSALIVGDISFLHDVASLALSSSARGPVAIFVIDNGGGKIFSQLPVASLDLDHAWHFWETPQLSDIEALCTGYGVDYVPLEPSTDLASILRQTSHGVTVFHTRVEGASAARFLTTVAEHL